MNFNWIGVYGWPKNFGFFVMGYIQAVAVKVHQFIEYFGWFLPTADSDNDEGNILPPPSSQPDVVTHENEIIEIDSSPSPPPAAHIVNEHESVMMTNTIHKMPKLDSVKICELIAILGGLTIGYIITVGGGVLAMKNFLVILSPKIFVKKAVAKENNFCQYVNQKLVIFVSSVHGTAAISTILAYILSDCWGRKPVLLLTALLLPVGVVCTTWFPYLWVEIVGRLILGIGVGFLYQVIPLISSETAPAESRKKVKNLFQFLINFGASLAYIVNYFASYQVWGWRVSFGIVGVVVIVILLASLAIKETPRCLILQGKYTQAKESLTGLRGTEVDVEFHEMNDSIERNRVTNTFQEIFKPLSRPALIIVTMQAVFQSLSGVNAVANFGPLIFQSLNFTSHEVFLAPMVIGFITALLKTLSLKFSNWIGRRKSKLVACGVSFFAQIFAWIFVSVEVDPDYWLERHEVYVLSILVLLSVAGNAIIGGSDGWLSETFPEKTANLGAVWSVCVTLLMTVIINIVSVSMYCSFGGWFFYFFAVCDIFTAWFIYLFLPETTGIKKHAFARRVWSRHWFWRRFVSQEELYA